jgi:hypothetical protein
MYSGRFDQYIKSNNVAGFINLNENSYNHSVIIFGELGIITKLLVGNGDIRNKAENIVHFQNGLPVELIQETGLFGTKRGGEKDAVGFMEEIQRKFWPSNYDLYFSDKETVEPSEIHFGGEEVNKFFNVTKEEEDVSERERFSESEEVYTNSY